MREHVGPYRILDVIGRGGMGVVYRGVHEALDRQVAVKALAPELTRDPQFRERFFAEARTQAHLQHPNIITIYDLLEDQSEFFIVMELVEGRGLDRMLEEGRLTAGEARALFAQILAALDSAHSKGVIHRDVKSSNVLVTDDGRVKLMDFGIALLVGDKRLTQSSQTIGTPIYMSPEQILRPRAVDHRTDIYSAGVLLYEMLTGVPPFDAETEYEVKKQHIETPFADVAAADSTVPPPFADALARALAKDPEERFGSAGEFLRALPGEHPGAAGGTGAAAVPAPPPPAQATRLEPAQPARSGSRSIRVPWLGVEIAPAAVRRKVERLAERLRRPGRARLWAAAAGVVLLVGLGWGLLALLGGSGDTAGAEPADRLARREPATAVVVTPFEGEPPQVPARSEAESAATSGVGPAAELEGGEAGAEEEEPAPEPARRERSPEPERASPASSSPRPEPRPESEPDPRPEPTAEPDSGPAPASPPEPTPREAGEAGDDRSDPTVVPTPKADSGPAPPSDPDARLVEAGQVARSLEEAVDRLEEVFDDRMENVEDTNPSLLETADFDLEDHLERLREAAEDLHGAYKTVAGREGLGEKRGLFRRMRGKLGDATRETFWSRAETVLRIGRAASESVAGAVAMDRFTRSLWQDVQADLDRLDRLAAARR